MTSKDFKVAIVGGGVCGLTCAIALVRSGVPVEVFEAAHKFGEVGAGIGIGPNASWVLKDIGVLDEVLAKAREARPNMQTFRFMSGMQGHEIFYEYPCGPDDVGLGVHRASYIDALVHLFDPNLAHFNKRCTAVNISPHNPSRYVLHFTDGTTHEADVVLGADGIKSAVRSAVTGEPSAARVAFSNTVAYRGLVPWKTIEEAGVKTDLTCRPICFVGHDKHIILFPINHGEIINIAAFADNYHIPLGSANLAPGAPWVSEVSQEELLKEYEGWGPDVINTLKCVQSPSKWSIHVVYPLLETYTKGRIALLGDAAHGMLPHLGSGAGQGLEDAWALARLLSHPQTNASNIEPVLEAYNRIRLPRSQMVWKASEAAGKNYAGCGKHGLTPEGVQADIDGQWSPVWHHDMNDDLKIGVQWLKDSGVFS
ncbi:FAD/NAD(P)-binding domain-containing protein [Obba rivulosa]|uniref:FAD/NAD(P)-binding domain-containing protein n=1 Tax=Obba rivulosa TaxID=1052685 RepID=A0A8E2J756_9APHY|nr:FAD/NAD(P)-binding domain-containing protein [Obba rivulosa]